MKNDCQYFENIFIDYINGTTNHEDTVFALEHLNRCENCKNNEMYNDFAFTWQKLDAWKEIQPSKHFMAKLQHEIALIEEKQILFWHRIDLIFSMFRVPIMTSFLLFFVSLNSISYADVQIIEKRKEVMEKRVNDFKEMKISDVLEKIIIISKEVNGGKK
ncbi:MAG: hypothetical protein U0457_19600 [Candidatus Sericytochromatia bacterium]